MAKNNQAPSTDRGSVIYKALWHAIIEQALQPGTKLPEDAIGEKFGWTNAQYGSIVSAGVFVYGLSVFFNGPIADRIGGTE